MLAVVVTSSDVALGHMEDTAPWAYGTPAKITCDRPTKYRSQPLGPAAIEL